ncbi:hypothetical protein FKP32DRAFT_1583654 [Trametes sanguinea]|nr:hypothetical protein FKP32DRAFT_1583654 [Trametes sanguinea]
MDSTLDCISRDFGISFSEKRRWVDLRKSISRSWQATRRLTRRSQTLPLTFGSTSRTSIPERWRLPLELLEQIIDNLCFDIAALRCCALVCHALVYRARRYLFHTIVIREKNFTKFVFLIVQQPHIAGFVRDLYFEAGGDAFFDLQKQPTTIVRVFALVIAPRLPNVARLTVKDVPFTQEVVEMLDPSFPQLYALSLFDCWFTCHSNLETLVKNHPRVHTLRCGRLCSLHRAESPDVDQSRAPLQMRVLKVTEAYAPTPLTLMPWLLGHVQPEKFTYTLYRLSQVAKLNQTISGYASMRHLHIIFYHWRKGDTDAVIESPQVMELTPHYPPNISTLTLDAKLHSLLLVVHVLARLDPHSFVRLQTVNIIAHVRTDEIEDIEYEAWAGMDQTLSVLLSLGEVNFTNSCQDPSHVEEGSAAILARLRVLAVRNMLSFVAEKPRE